MIGRTETLEFRLSPQKAFTVLSMAWLALCPSNVNSAYAQRKNPNRFTEESSTSSRSEPTRNHNAKTSQTDFPKEKTPVKPAQKIALSLGAGLYFPLTRPKASLSLSNVSRATELALRLSGSYISVSKSFQDAAARNQTYGSRLSDANAYVWDMDLAAPELTLRLPANFFVSGTSFGRLTRCVSTYTSSTGSPLVFSGWSLAVGLGGQGGFRFSTSKENFSLDFYGGLTWPAWSFGSSDVSYTPQDVADTQTFSEDDLATILDSLQLYVKALSYQFTTEAGIRAAWRF